MHTHVLRYRRPLGLPAFPEGENVQECSITPTVYVCAQVYASGLPAFRKVSQEVLRGICFGMIHEHYDPGQLIIRQGDVGDAMFIVLTVRSRARS